MSTTARHAMIVLWQAAVRQDATMSRQWKALGNLDRARYLALSAANAKREVNRLLRTTGR